MSRRLFLPVLPLAVALLASSLGAQKSPDEFFQVRVGSDRTLIAYPRIVSYFRHLAEASLRVRLSEEGKTTLGSGMILAAISSEENIRNFDQLVRIGRLLSSPDWIPEGDAQKLVGQAKVFVLITASIHASEIGASQMAMILAHQLATGSDPRLRAILDQTVVLLMPSINPDGQIMVCDWYNKQVGTPYEGGGMPFLYHHYAGHDNNRDYFMLNLEESRVLNAVIHQRYFPQIFLDMHQMGGNGPRIFVPPFQNPFNQNLSPLMLREVELLGAAMALALQEAGKTGVANSYGFDAYWPGGTKNTAWYKNVVGLLTELASARVATPVYVDPSELRGGGKGLPEYKPQVNFPEPWIGGWWRLSDVIDYELIACRALLETAAKNCEMFVANYCRMGKESVRLGQNEPPYAYIIPRRQWDGPEAADFLEKMQQHGVRLFRLREDWNFGGRLYEKGSHVIPLAQPFRGFVKVMLERQRYPEIRMTAGGPILEPYDATGWTLPLLMNVKSEEVDVPVAGAPLEPVAAHDFPAPSFSGQGNHVLLPARYNRTFLAVNRLMRVGLSVLRLLPREGSPGGIPSGAAPGDFLAPAGAAAEKVLAEVFQGSGVVLERVGNRAMTASAPLSLPRIAIYQSYLASADEGWTRWILDRFEFPYRVVHNSELRDKLFAQKFDAVIFPSQGRSAIVDGRYSERPDRPAPFLPKEYQGGIGKEGTSALKELVDRGGRIILLDAAWELAQKDFELPLANALGDRSTGKFSCPGSLLKIQLDNSDPLAWGLEQDASLFFADSAIFRAANPEDQRIQRRIVGRFPAAGPHLLSGYLEGGDMLNNGVTALRYQYSKGGQVVVFGGRIQYRAQSTGTFKLLFNAIWLPR